MGINWLATEKVVQYLKRHSNTDYALLINTICKDSPEFQEVNFGNVLSYLSHKNFISETSIGGALYFTLTDKGDKLKELKTFEAFQKWEAAENEKNEEIERLTTTKLKYDVKNSQRIFKTYWWTFTFAIIGLGSSIVLIVLKLMGK